MKRGKISKVRKRDKNIVNYDNKKILNAVLRASCEVGWRKDITEIILKDVEKKLFERFIGRIPSVEDIQDIVEEVLIKQGYHKVAKAYILYRNKRKELRSSKAYFGVKDDLKLSLNAIKVLQERYLLKDENGKIIETPLEMFRRVSHAIAKIDLAYNKNAYWIEEEFFKVMANLEFLPNTPCLMNAGTSVKQLNACFTPDQMIFSNPGMKSIVELNEGDSVVTHIGRFRKITRKMKRDYEGALCKIKVRGIFDETLSVTCEHPILAIKKEDIACVRDNRLYCRRNKRFCYKVEGRNSENCNYLYQPRVVPRWINAGDLDEGDYVVVSAMNEIDDVHEINVYDTIKSSFDRNVIVDNGKVFVLNKEPNRNGYFDKRIKPINNIIKIDSNFMTLVGYWLAEGSFDDEIDAVHFTFNSNESKYCKEVLYLMKKVFGIKTRIEYEKSQNTAQLRFHSKILARFFYKLFNKGFDKKNIPSWFLLLSHHKQMSLICSLFRGDGHMRSGKKQDIIFLSLSNKNLALNIWNMLLRLGFNFNINANINSYKDRNGLKKVSRSLAYRISSSPSSCRDLALKVKKTKFIRRNIYSQYIKLGNLMLRPIDKLERVHYKGEVYNLEVDEDHSYLANAVAVHNCYVIPIEDSLDKIYESLKVTALIQRTGGGTGFSFSRLRPKNSIVGSTKGKSSGPVSFMRLYDKSTDVIKSGGKRRGANIGILRADHPDILEFVNCKDENFENFNISVSATNKFMQAVLKNKNFELKFGDIKKEIKAKNLFDNIVNQAWKTGDPGLIFIDEINKKHSLKEEIESTNPCGEQPLLGWESCVLGSINLSKFIENKKINWEKLRNVVRTGVHFLDNVIDANYFITKNIEEVTLGNRKIGLGIMGFADMLIKLNIKYDSDKALRLGKKIMKFISNEGRKKSIELGREKGNFPNINKSKLKKYKHMRNATITTVAPTGTISIIASCSSGIEPLYSINYVRNILDSKLFEKNELFEEELKKRNIYSEELMYDVAKEGSLKNIRVVPNDLKKIFVTAKDISYIWHVRMQAAFQKYTDNAVSKTINLAESATKEDIKNAFLLAYKLKCKGITVFRSGCKGRQVLEENCDVECRGLG